MIELVTFTGVDSRTVPKELRAVARRWPQVEFGVLVGSKTGNAPIFPPLDVVRKMGRLGQDEGLKMALHLCGPFARQAIESPEMIHKLSVGFGRVQINLPAKAAGTWGGFRERLARFVQDTPADRVILQHRGPWHQVPVSHKQVEFLFDRSGGRGRVAFDEWPAPPRAKRVGFSGGIGPDNIGLALEFAAKHPKARLWFDMEGRIRTDGWLDIKAIQSVCQQVWG